MATYLKISWNWLNFWFPQKISTFSAEICYEYQWKHILRLLVTGAFFELISYIPSLITTLWSCQIFSRVWLDNISHTVCLIYYLTNIQLDDIIGQLSWMKFLKHQNISRVAQCSVLRILFVLLIFLGKYLSMKRQTYWKPHKGETWKILNFQCTALLYH